MAVQQHLMWQNLKAPGLEHVLVGQGWASSTVIGKTQQQPFTLRYRIEVDRQGVISACVLRVSGAASLTLTRSAGGRWQGNGGEDLSDLSGCSDLNLSATPYTNSLALRRLSLRPGQSGEVLAAWINVPSLRREVSRQRYTRVGQRTYQFERLSGHASGYSAELKVDDELMVLEYPGSFQRV